MHTTQPFSENDLTSLTEVQPHDWPDIVPFFRFYTDHDFCFPIKLVSENKIIGTGAIIVHEEVAWLAHIIVSPNHRNKGIGRFITKTLIELAQNKNCSTLYLIATDLGAPVYEKLGFETESDYLFFKDLKGQNISSLSSYIVPFHAEHETAILQMDREVSGENRKTHLEEHAPHGFVFQKNDRIEGYYLPTFSEGLIIADTTEAGIELLKMKLTRDDKIAFPKENQRATNYLYSLGYKEFKTAKRMRMGIKRPLRLEKIYSRIGGYLG